MRGPKRSASKYRGDKWAHKDARDDLVAWLWTAAGKSAKRLAQFDHEVRVLTQQQGTLMVAEQNLRLQTLVWWLAIVAALAGIVSAYEPALRLFKQIGISALHFTIK